MNSGLTQLLKEGHGLHSMSEDQKIELNQNALDVGDAWLGESPASEEKEKQPTFDPRARRLGLGAKYVPHKRVVLEKGAKG